MFELFFISTGFFLVQIRSASLLLKIYRTVASQHPCFT